MGHSIAAKYAARPAARFVRPSTRARERRLGLLGSATFAPASRRVTELRAAAGPLGGLRPAGPAQGRPARRPSFGGRPRPSVRMVWTRSDRPGPGRRSGLAAAPWRA